MSPIIPSLFVRSPPDSAPQTTSNPRSMERELAHPAAPGLTTLVRSDSSPRTILAGSVTTLADVGIGDVQGSVADAAERGGIPHGWGEVLS